jgi:hypothetical protein
MSATRLEFHPLTFVEERDGIMVGRSDTESYAVLPTDGAALLHRLHDGMPLLDAADWYRVTFGESIDMADFVAALHDLGFVKVVGDEPAESSRVRFQALGRAVFSPMAWLCYAGLVGGCFLAVAAHPQLRPQVQNVFFSPSLIVVQVLLVLVQLPAILWHEWFHVLAARRLGLPSRLGVNRRLYFVVFETHLNGLLGVPRKQRYLPFLAGMLADVFLFCGLTLGAAADLDGGLSWVGRFALAIAYTVLLRLAWQFYVFLRTDLYYVFTTALGCTNLHEATSSYLRDRFGWLPGVKRPTEDAVTWSPRDRQVAPWFALLTVGGVGFLLSTVLFAIIPVTLEFAARLGSALAHGATEGARFWDSAVFLLIVVVQLVVLPLLAGRSRKSHPQSESSSGLGR